MFDTLIKVVTNPTWQEKARDNEHQHQNDQRPHEMADSEFHGAIPV